MKQNTTTNVVLALFAIITPLTSVITSITGFSKKLFHQGKLIFCPAASTGIGALLLIPSPVLNNEKIITSKVNPHKNMSTFLHKTGIFSIAMLVLTFIFVNNSFGQSTQTFTTSGTFIPPAGVTSVTVQCWGGGGAGAGGTSSGTGGGGGGGAYKLTNNVTVISGSTYTITVGTGGTGSNANGTNGGSSSAIGVTANGGTGGTFVNAGNGGGGTGGGGGTYNGGSGASGNIGSPYGGGGGSSAGTGSNGTTAINFNGAAAVSGGGGGGNGSNGTGNGSSGNNPGGGGGGARSRGSSQTGGTGAAGQVIITYTCQTYSLTSVTSPAICLGNSATVTLSNSTVTNLPVGTYTVNYTLSGANTGAFSTSMTISSAGTGTITTAVLANSGTTTITINSLASGSAVTSPLCTSALSNTGTIQVNINTAGSPSSNPTLCINTALSPIITIATTGATGIGTATGLPAGVTAVWASNIITISGSPTASGTFNYSIPLTGGCGSVYTSGTITVNPLPIITSVIATPSTICTGSTSNLVVAAPAAGTATTIVNYDFNAGANLGSLTPTLASGITCTATGNNITLSSGIGTSTGSQAFTNNSTAGNALLSNTGGGANTLNFSLAGASLNLYSSFKIYFQTRSGGNNWITVSYNANNTGFTTTGIGGTNPVSSPDNNGIWTEGLLTLPTAVDNPSSLVIQLSITTGDIVYLDNFQIQGIPNIYSYSWTASPSGTTAGLPGGAGSASVSNVSIAVNPAVTTVYTVTTTNGCGTVSGNVTVTVNPTPTLTGASQSATVCSGAGAIINLTGLLANSTSTINYSINNVAQTAVSSVVADGSGAANFTSASLTAANNGQTLQITGVTTTSNTPNCSQSFTQNVTLSVNPSPTVNAGGAMAAICQGGTSATLGGSFGGGATAAIWSDGGAGGTFTNNTGATPNNTKYIASATSSSLVTLTLTTSGGLCGTVSASKTIIVNPTSVGGTATAAAATLCSGISTTISVSGYTGNIQWQQSANGSSGWANVTGGSGATTATYTTPGLAATTYYRALLTSGVCSSSTSTVASVSVYSTNTWFGTTSDANLSSNWSCGTPVATDVIIPSNPVGSHMPELTGDLSLNNITLGSGASISLGGNTLTINGAVTGTGTLSGSATSNLTIGGSGSLGTLYFDQSNYGTSNALNNIVVNRTSSGTITLGSSLIILNSYAPTNGLLTISTGDTLILRSTASNTAIITQGSSSGNYISGNVTVERYIPSSNLKGRRYRLLTPTVTTSTSINANWQEGQVNTALSPAGNIDNNPGYGVQITGPGGSTNGFDATQTNASSLYLCSNGFNDGIHTPALSYSIVTNTNVNKLNPFTGYYLFVRGSRAQNMNLYNTNVAPNYIELPSDNTTVRATGTLAEGDINTSITNPFTNPIADGGYGYMNLITNPFPCPIDWSKVYASCTKIDKSYAMWDANLGSRGGFVSVKIDGTVSTSTGGSSAASIYIQPGQAFYVQTLGTGTPVINILEAHKVTGGHNNNGIFTQQTAPQTFSASIYYYEGSGNRRLAAGATAVYDNSYSAAVDEDDALETTNWDENVAINRQGYRLAIEARPLIVSTDTLPLFMNHMHQMTYEYEFTGSNFSDPTIQATLIDNYTGNQTPLNVNGTTVVPFTITSVAASGASDRFMVVFGPAAGPLPVIFSSVNAYQKNQGVQVDWLIETEQNIANYEVERSSDGLNFSKVGTVASLGNSSQRVKYGWFDANPFNGINFYRIKSIDKDAAIKYSNIVKVNINKLNVSINAAISIYPNPVSNRNIAVQFTDMPKGIYQLRLMNDIGQVLLTQQVNYTGGSSNQNIGLNADIINGNYRLEIIQPDNTIVVKSVTVLK